MRICLRRAAHISAERLISVQTDMQTDIDMDRDVDVDVGDKFAYIYGPSALERSVNQQVLEASKVTTGICNRVLP
jgi:hypothetical protein